MDALNNLTSVISTMGSFNATEYKTWVGGNLTTVMNTINTWTKGEVVDLDTTNFDILKTMSQPTDSSWTNCNAAFNSDSWVPSNSQNSSYDTIPCQVGSGTGDSTTCTAALADSGGNTCAGCMDSADLSTLITVAANLKTALDTKYTGTCTFNAKMENVWTNYYLAKNAIYGPTDTATTVTGVRGRALES